MKVTQSLLVALGALAVADARRFGSGGSGKQFGGGSGAAGNSTGMVIISDLWSCGLMSLQEPQQLLLAQARLSPLLQVQLRLQAQARPRAQVAQARPATTMLAQVVPIRSLC